MREQIKKSGIFTAGDVHVNTALADVSIAYKQNALSYVASQAFPSVKVQKQSDVIFAFDKNDWLRNEAGIRAPGTESSGGGFAITSDTNYFAKPHAWHQDIPIETLRNSDLSNLEVQVAEAVMQKLLIDREVDWTTNYFTTSLWADQGGPDDATGDATNTAWPYFVYFSDQANSDPQNTIILGQESIQQNTGYKPNTLIAGLQVHNQLRKHADVKEQVKYTSSANVGNSFLAQFFDIDKYLVGSSIRATNIEGDTGAYSFNLGKSMLLVYAPPSPGILTPSGGYTFEWTGLNDLGYDVTMESWWEQKIHSQRVEGNMAYDAKLLCKDMGVFFDGAIA